MKKIVSILILFALILSVLSGCNLKNDTHLNSDKLSIVTTIYPYYEFAKNITEDKAEIKLLLSPGAEPHDYDPSPSDIVAIEKCDIFIYNGGESDEWVEGILKSLDNKKVNAIRMMDYVEPICAESHHHEENENHNEHEEHAHEFDEHIWTSVINAKKIVQAICELTQSCDKDNAKHYYLNSQQYIEQLSALDAKFNSIINNSNQKYIVVGDRFPLRYFANDYGIDYVSAFSGCNSETQPGIATVIHLIDFVRENDIPVVIYLDFSSDNIAKLISEDSDAKVRKMWSCHNVTKEEFENKESYISLMNKNAKILEEALS